MAHAPRLTVRVEEDWYDSPVAVPLVRALLAELHDRYGQDDADPDGLDAPQLATPQGTFVVAWIDGDAVGCGALRRADERVGEIKRMYVRPAWRGYGVGRAVLGAVEARARALGYERLILETGTRQPEAVGLYTSAGYEPISPYGAYRWSPLSRCYARDLRVTPRALGRDVSTRWRVRRDANALHPTDRASMAVQGPSTFDRRAPGQGSGIRSERERTRA